MSYIPKDEDWASAFAWERKRQDRLDAAAPPRWEYPIAAVALGILWTAAIALAVLT